MTAKFHFVLAAAIIAGFMPFHGVLAADKISIPETKTPPPLSGRLDDSAWRGAEKIDDFYLPRSAGGALTNDTEVYLCHDSKWLYIGVRCKNSAMSQMDCVTRDHDGAVNQDDSVEIFLKPAGADKFYYQFMLSFANVTHERRMVNGNQDVAWGAPWRAKTAVTADGWTGEIAIPLFAVKDCLEPGLKMNIARNKNEAQIDDMGAKQSERKIFSGAAKLERGAHEPENFISAAGLENVKPEIPFVPVIDSASAGGYLEESGRIFYTADATVSPAASVTGVVRAVVSELKDGAWRAAAEETVNISGSKRISFKVPSGDFNGRDVRIELFPVSGGESLAGAAVKNTDSLEAVRRVVSYLNYYTRAETVKIRAHLGLPEGRLAKSALEISAAGKSLFRKDGLSPVMTLEFPASQLSEGSNALEIALLDGSVKTASKTLEVRCFQEAAPSNVRINNFDRVMMKDGKPFFLFGIFTDRTGANAAPLMRYLSSEAGFNTVTKDARYGERDSLADLPGWMSAARDCGLNVIEYPALGKKASEAAAAAAFEPMKPKITKAAEILRSEPNFLMWYNVDEPNLGTPDVNIKVAEWFHKTVRAADPRNPFALLYAKYIPAGNKWTDYGDVLFYDIYSCPDWGGFFSEPGLMTAHFTCMLEERAARDGKVAMVAPLSGTLLPPRCPVGLTRQEQICQSYAAVIYGAKGLLYFTLGCVNSAEQWDALKTLGGQFKELGPAITAPAVAQEISYPPGKLIPASRIFPMVNARVFRHPGGDFVMPAVNIMPFAVKARFSIDGLRGASLMFEKENDLKVSGGVFDEKFEPYGVRVFRLRLAEPETVKVSLSMEAAQEEKVSPPPSPLSKIIGSVRQGKNLMPNPVMARQKLKGLPDFITPYSIQDPVTFFKTPLCAADSAVRWEGHPSFRMISETASFGGPAYFGVTVGFYPLVSKKPETYTFSFFAKTAAPGTSVGALFQKTETGAVSQNFKLGSEWGRHSVTVTLPPVSDQLFSGGQAMIITRPDKTGVPVWISGIQMEKGETMTGFRDDSAFEEVPEDPDNLVKNGGAESGRPEFWRNVKTVSGAAHSGNWSFTGKSAVYFGAESDFFEVDTEKTYRVGGWFKNQGGKPASLAFGVIPFDKDKRQILPENLLTVKNSETELTEPCAASDLSIKVKDASKWIVNDRAGAAFEPEKGLPNFRVSPLGIKNIVRASDCWEIILSKPCGRTYPAGAKVAEGVQSGIVCMYPFRPVKSIPAEWTEYSAVIKGQAKEPAAAQWWPGTKYAKLMITIPANGDSVLFDDISVKELK